MGQRVIGGRDQTADMTIGGVSMRSVLNEFECESNVELIDSSVFSIEGVPTQEPGMERIFFRMSGLLKKGGNSSSDTLFVPAPQSVATDFVFSGYPSPTCWISFLANFSRILLRRTVNRNGIIQGEGTSNGAFMQAWDATS